MMQKAMLALICVMFVAMLALAGCSDNPKTPVVPPEEDSYGGFILEEDE